MTFTMPQPNAIWGGCVVTEIKLDSIRVVRESTTKPLDSQSGFLFFNGSSCWWFLKSDSFSYDSWLEAEKNFVSGGFLLLNFSGCMTKKPSKWRVVGFRGCISGLHPPNKAAPLKNACLLSISSPHPHTFQPTGMFFWHFFGMQIHPSKEYIVRNSHDCGQGWCMTPNLNILNEALKFRMSRIFVPLLSRNISTISV